MHLQLETTRLLLRPFELSDAVSMFEMDKNPSVHKYLWQKPAVNLEESKEIILYVQKQYTKHKIGRFATILKETNEFIGWTGIKYVDDHVENGTTNFYDYGYRLNQRFWNMGFATEATKFWLEYGFDKMGIKEMNAFTHSQNDASNHILNKSGFHFIEDYQDVNNTTWKWWQILHHYRK